MMIYIFLSSLILSLFLFYQYREISLKKKLFDKPDGLSVHDKPIPTGSGIVFFIVIIFFLIFKNFIDLKEINNIQDPKNYLVFLIAISSLFIISFYDDFKKIHPVIRLFFQTTIIFFCTSLFDVSNISISVKLILIFIVYFWVYTINIVNFTDGSDGFLATNSIIFFLCSSIYFFIYDNLSFNYFLSSILTGSLFAYLLFNKPKASIFMGDSGSILLGFLIGYFSINFIIIGRFDISISLLAYTYMDCTITIFKKILKKKAPWARLFDYYFLIPLKKNFPHSKVFLANLIYNLLIFVIVIIQIIYDLKILCLISLILSTILLLYFRSFRDKKYQN